ncbi:MAG: hypothetical protein RMY28_006480 [Nostoc sp. ChiSLP01]
MAYPPTVGDRSCFKNETFTQELATAQILKKLPQSKIYLFVYPQ